VLPHIPVMPNIPLRSSPLSLAYNFETKEGSLGVAYGFVSTMEDTLSRFLAIDPQAAMMNAGPVAVRWLFSPCLLTVRVAIAADGLMPWWVRLKM
jgi:hypothetical protein